MKRKSSQKGTKPTKKLKTIDPDSSFSFSDYEHEKEASLSSIEVESDSCIESDVNQSFTSNRNNQKKSKLSPKNNGKEAKAKIATSSSKSPTSFSELKTQISQLTKSHFKAKIDEHSKLLKNVANFGAKTGSTVTMNRKGEYFGLSFLILSPLKPLITERKMINAIEKIESENFAAAAQILDIEEYVRTEGLSIIFVVIRLWLKRQNIQPPSFLEDPELDSEKIDEINRFACRKRDDSLPCKLRIISVGESKKGHSVVPEEWLGKEFQNGEELHREIDQLDWRKGKPPVVYCATYGMALTDENEWTAKKDMREMELINFSHRFGEKEVLMISLESLNDGDIKSSFELISSSEEKLNWLRLRKEEERLIYFNKAEFQPILIACKLSDFFESDPKFEKSEKVALLVSRLQKCIRRGIEASQLTQEVIPKLRMSQGYNLPDHHFLRVSSNRQLFWRLFISCIEDSFPYMNATQNKGIYLGLMDLCILALICSIDDNLQINKKLEEACLRTALLIQANTSQKFDWREGKENDQLKMNFLKSKNEYPIYNTMILALRTQPMMSGDRKMMYKYLDMLRNEPNYKFDLLAFKNYEFYLSKTNNTIYLETFLSAIDMHCYPNIILVMQGSLKIDNLQNYSTRDVSKMIWDLSSCMNIRNKSISPIKISKNERIFLTTLREIQSYIENHGKNYLLDYKKLAENYKAILDQIKKGMHISNKKYSLSQNLSRVAFLNLFGMKIRLTPQKKSDKNLEGILCGNINEPAKIKSLKANKMIYLEGNERQEGEIRYFNELSKRNTYFCINPEPPNGFEWVWSKKKKVEIHIEKSHIQDEYRFFADDIEISLFNAEKVLISQPILNLESNIPHLYSILVSKALFIETEELNEVSDFELNLLLRSLGQERINKEDFRTYDFTHLFSQSKIAKVVYKHCLIKLFNCNKDEVLIGPVDLRGKKLQNSISYNHEGQIWRIFNLLSFLFPGTLLIVSELKFKIERQSCLFPLLIDFLTNFSHEKHSIPNAFTLNNNKNPEIITTLWDHQKNTIDRMVQGYLSGKRGFGDASCVGAGKTLTALGVVQKLIEHSKTDKYRGILILLPTTNLFKTWTDEIKKHSKGFKVAIQQSNGELEPKNIQICKNTLVISTLGRFRDHAIYYSWQLVIIDECLSVQNREALQTEEAWKQVILSEFGVLMMSATFFRSRFEKMFFMLKMLRSGLPEEKDYLDCILNEAIICYISENNRKWITNVNRFHLTDKQREKYEEIRNKDIPYEQLYKLLESFLLQNFNLIPSLKTLIQKLEKDGQSILIYAKSKAEADYIAQNIDSVSRFPDIQGTHTVVAYSEGTYGLNELVKFSCILTRPPEPDKLPQMKGRLDRPGQKRNLLNLEYFLIGESIEEGLLIRLEIANRFFNSYLMPLARFYEISVGKGASLIE